MSIRSAQPITAIFPTHSASTGAATNADTAPTGTLYVNGTADVAIVAVTNIATGLYKASVTLPALAFGDQVELVRTATVASVTTNLIIWRDTKDVGIDNVGRIIAVVDVAGSIAGDLAGKVLGDSDATIIGAGAWVLGDTGALAASEASMQKVLRIVQARDD